MSVKEIQDRALSVIRKNYPKHSENGLKHASFAGREFFACLEIAIKHRHILICDDLAFENQVLESCAYYDLLVEMSNAGGACKALFDEFSNARNALIFA